ncbi:MULTISPECIES: AAA family ATPase [Enterococcus]
MNQGRIIVITGAPGTGKTTTASVVAKESDLEKSSVCICTQMTFIII